MRMCNVRAVRTYTAAGQVQHFIRDSTFVCNCVIQTAASRGIFVLQSFAQSNEHGD
jgi:hypothetical protein